MFPYKLGWDILMSIQSQNADVQYNFFDIAFIEVFYNQ